MVKFQALVDGKVVAEGSTMSEALANAEHAGYNVAEIRVRSVRDGMRV